LGDYEGTIWVTSNDPEVTTIEIPVYFTVDYASAIESIALNDIRIHHYPNPFKEHITFDVYLPAASFVDLEIYNFSGQRIYSLIHQNLNSGNYTFIWNGDQMNNKEVKNGIYFYRFKAGQTEKTGKLILLD